MSPMEKIKKGIQTQDWNLVCFGYNEMTGEELCVVSQKQDAQGILHEIIAIAESAINTPKTKSESTTTGKTKKSKKKTVEKKQSHLITEEPDPEEIKANKARAARTNKQKRPPPKTYVVECNECGQKITTKFSGGEIGQKCKNCLNKLKRHR